MQGGAGDSFPYWRIRLIGAVQISIGILVFVLGVVDLILTKTLHDSDIQKYGQRYEVVVTLTVISSPLWCSIWFFITGILGACMSHDRTPSLLYSKVGCLILNVLCCSLFGPACAIINGFISYKRYSLNKGDYHGLFSIIICLLAIIEVVMATVSASLTCCSSNQPATPVKVFVNSRSATETDSDMAPSKYSRSMSCPSRINNFKTISYKKNNNTRNNLFIARNNINSKTSTLVEKWTQAKVVTANQSCQTTGPTPTRQITENLPTQQHDQVPVEDGNQNELTQPARNTPKKEAVDSSSIQDPFHTSSVEVSQGEETPANEVMENIPTKQIYHTPAGELEEHNPTKEINFPLPQNTDGVVWPSSYMALKKWALPR